MGWRFLLITIPERFPLRPLLVTVSFFHWGPSVSQKCHRRSLPQSGPTETHWSCGLQLGKSRKTRPGRGDLVTVVCQISTSTGGDGVETSIHKPTDPTGSFKRDSKFVSSIQKSHSQYSEGHLLSCWDRHVLCGRWWEKMRTPHAGAT